MGTFLDRARDLLVTGAVTDSEDDFKRVFGALVELRDVFFKSGLDLDNIESVFGAFEIARIIGKLGRYSTEQIDDLVKSIRVLIVRTLDESIKYYHSRNDSTPHLSGSYARLAGLIKAINLKSGDHATCSLLTFNYDMAIDYALMCAQIPYNYCLEPSTIKDAAKLLKLHGSLNWSRCAGCEKINGVESGGLAKAVRTSQEQSVQPTAREEVCSFPVSAATMIAQSKCVECAAALPKNPIIVPPTWNKSDGHNALKAVWKQAATELGQAENIICIGYSLPESDLFFRYLFALGTVGEAHIRRFWVFDPDPMRVVEERYRRLIGKGIESRFRFFHDEDGKFSSSVSSKGELWQTLVSR